MDNLEKKIDKLTEEIISLRKEVFELKNSCSRMDNHINFVENTYSTLKYPLDFMKTKINSLTGATQNLPLPDPSDFKNEDDIFDDDIFDDLNYNNSSDSSRISGI